ncbi:hypothetical protein Tco_0940771 [Tanacetum coccineum]|uniref:Uncharacterized protein n=1 Tax=Tanacetum coccineum TaxID=301880 RepID=A0ABQ5DRI4_9ASTR
MGSLYGNPFRMTYTHLNADVTRDPPPNWFYYVPTPRKKLDSEFNDEENKLEMADTQAEIILSQGLPRHIFNILNQTSTAQEIWNNVEYCIKIHGRTHNNEGRSVWMSYETLSHRSSLQVLLSHFGLCAHNHIPPALSSPSTPSPQPTAQSPNDALMATMTQIANLLSGFQKQFPPTNNQLRTSSNSRTHATVHDGHIVTKPVQRKAPGNVGNFRSPRRQEGDMCYNCRGEGLC